MLLDLSRVPQEARRQLLEILASEGKIRPSCLGVSRAYFYQMKRGLRPVPDRLLKKILECADDDDLARVEYFAQYIDYSRVRKFGIEKMLALVLAWAEANPASARVLIQTLDAELRKRGLVGPAVYVTSQLLEEWERYLESRVAAGTLSKKQARDHMNYLRRLLEATGGVLAPEPVSRTILSVARV